MAMQMLLAAMLIDAAHGRVATQCETKCGTKKARNVAGGADCHSVSSGLTARAGSVLGGFDWSLTVCGRGSFRAGLATFLDALAASCFGITGGIIGLAFGMSRENSSRPSGKVADSNHWEIADFRSSIAAHPARPKLADMSIRTSATRAQARIDNLAVGFVAGASLVGPQADTKVAPYGCRAVNGEMPPRLVQGAR
jgi:hypothetical protein